jgi:hypothetical protein
VRFEPGRVAMKKAFMILICVGLLIGFNSLQPSVAGAGKKIVGEDQGRATHAEYTAKFDGKDYPWKGTIDGKPNLSQDTTSWKRIDNYTYESSAKLKGQVLTTQRTVVARDGKTRTNTVTGKNAQGQVVNATIIYERQ